MAKRRRVGVMLDLDAAYRRHVGVYKGAHEYAKEQEWELVIDEYVADTLPPRAGLEVPYDGVIARAPAQLARRAARLGVPVVNVWLNSPARKQLPGVFPDFEACGRIRAEHLLARGLRRFSLIVSSAIGIQREKAAFCRVVAEAGHPFTVTEVPHAPTASLAQWRLTERIITAAIQAFALPIGVFVGGENVGRLLAQACRSRGLRVPDDVAIITGHNETSLCEPPPSLTSVELGSERIGYEAARLLDRMMEGATVPQETLLPPVGLVVRESTDFFAVDDELIAKALGFIAANSHRQIGAADVAQAVNTEIRTLQRRFRNVLDRPIATQIRRVRIERAKRELAQNQLSLTAIAYNAGFGSAMRMYEVFRRELGVTPREYRRQRQGHATP